MNMQQPAMLHGIKAVIIDLDGTMLDTAPDFHVAINRMRTEQDLAPLSIETIKNFVGKGAENLIRSILANDFDAEQVERHFESAMASYQRHYFAINGNGSHLYPGVIEGLDALKAKGLRLACVTNKQISFAEPLLHKKGLATYFDVVYGGDSLRAKKPDPYPMLKVCEDFSLQPRQVVAIGDSSNDAQAARAAGCHVLHVPYGYNHGRAIQTVDSDGIVPTLLDAAFLISV